MPDRGHELTDELLKEIEKRVKIEYEQAYREMQKKLSDYMSTFDKKDAIQKQLLKDGKITEREYKNWRYRHMMMNKRWEDMRDTLAEDMHNVNLIATRIMKGEMPQVYSLNHDYATYQIEHDAKIDTSYTLYNHDTAERLLKQQQELLPKPSARKARELKENPDIVWNQQKLQSAVLQGVLQGESPYAIAQRLRSVADMNYHASVRHARTMTTNVQNAGREDAYNRAKSKGVELTEIWIATLDGRTRHSHRQMHGDKKDEKKGTFSNGLRWPGDPRGAAHEVYNCRCTTNAYVKGFEPELVTSSPKMGDMSFDEWQNEKAPVPRANQKPRIDTGELPPNPREYSNYFEYRKALEEYEGTRSYYEGGESNFKKYRYSEAEWENVKEFDATIAELNRDYPLPAGLDISDYDDAEKFLTARQIQNTMTEDAAAQLWYNTDTDRFAIGYRPNTSYRSYEQAIQERQRFLKEGKNLLDIASGSAQGEAIHEYGHALSEYISRAMIHDDKDALEYWEWYKTLSKDEIKRGISLYAATNRAEFEAECFAELMMPKPRPLALKYKEYLVKCMESNYNDDGKGTPVTSALQMLARRKNVDEMPTLKLGRTEYSRVSRELATWIDQEDCPKGTLQCKYIFNEESGKAYLYWFERTDDLSFRIVGKRLVKEKFK